MLMRVTVVRPGDLGPSEAALWAQFQQLSPVMLNPFLSLTYVQVVGRARSNARIAVVEENGQIQAFLPYELTPRRIARPIGWPMNNLQGFIASGVPFDPRSVVSAASLRGWRFDAVPAEQRLLTPYHYRDAAVLCQVIDLSGGYASYLQSRPRSMRREAGRTRRAAERAIGPLSLEWRSRNPEHLRRLMEWKSAKYEGTQRLLADPTSMRILEELMVTDNPECSGVLSLLFAGSRMLAADYKLQSNSTCYGWFTGYDSTFSHYALGTMILLAVAEAADRGCVDGLDLGPGQDRYKQRLGNRTYPVSGGAVWACRLEGMVRGGYRWLVHERSAHSTG